MSSCVYIASKVITNDVFDIPLDEMFCITKTNGGKQCIAPLYLNFARRFEQILGTRFQN
jgi:hypothetical protein